MEIEKTEYLVTGTPNEKTKEKIRLKLRQLLNVYKKCIIGITTKKDIPRLAYEFELVGYKYLFFIYKSTAVEKIAAMDLHFQNRYQNELFHHEHQDIQNTDALSEEGPFLLYLLGKSKKRVF